MEDYEIEVNKNVKRNKKFIKEFEEWLKEKGLKTKTIRKHISNIDLYINDYLNYYEVTKMEKGVSKTNMFFSDWFIRKCLWSSVTSIKETAASIKKFYQCMLEKEYINKEDYEFVYEVIKNNINDWIEELEEYELEEDNFFDFI